MERDIKVSSDVILLLDNYGQDSQSLHLSLGLAGYDCQTIVIEDNGFLPNDVMSVYGFFLGDFKDVYGSDARPKYFNEILVPDYWEISGNNNIGKVQDLSRERGKIFYIEPKRKRLVKEVDWYDERGTVRSSDHYNRYGAIFARTIFSEKGKRVNKSYFSAEGKEIIVENYVTGDIILNEDGEVSIFRTKTDLVLHFLAKAGLNQKRIFFNSLSTPFFVSNKLGGSVRRDVLFWQEPVKKEIPGNMQMIFNGQAARTTKIMVQKKQAYDKLRALGARRDIMHKLGFIYSFERENMRSPEGLICTNSDKIEHCEEIVRALPQMHFHIAALTEMSSKLMEMEDFENVSLYPNVKPDALDELFVKCDYYFDINYEAEIVSAVRRAFLHNHLIFAFDETVHNRDYVAEECIYPAGEAAHMIAEVQSVLADGAVLDRFLEKQREAAFAETIDSYRGL